MKISPKNIYKILAVLIFVILFSRFDVFYFRKKTFMEKNYRFCLPGIITQTGDFSKTDDVFIIRNIFIEWEDINISGRMKPFNKKNNVIMITWEPYLGKNKDISILSDIISGKYDGLIKKFADTLKKYNNLVLLRWGHEVNGSWYSWSGNSYGNSPEKYIKAYRHIADLFKGAEAVNIKFVFCVNSEDVPKTKGNRFENYYPGSEYVDIIGVDVYNWGDTQVYKNGKKSKWKSFKNIMIPAYERIVSAYPDKPIIISEIGSSSSGGDKYLWIEEFLLSLEKRFPAVKATVWFDINKETDWGISHDRRLYEKFLEFSWKDYYNDNADEFRKLLKY